MRRKLLAVFLVSTAVAMSSCGGVESLIEQALFALDQCNPTNETTLASCQEAVDKADEVQTSEAANADAALAESSGYLGLARLDFLSFVSDLTDLANNVEGDFSEFRGIVTDYEADLNADQSLTGLELDLADLQSSKDAFGTLLDGVEVDDDGFAVDETLRRAAFQLGVIQALDAFIRPVKIAGTNGANVVDIDATVTAATLADFLNADNNLLIGGTTEEEGEDLIKPVRENYCRCSLQTPLGATAGFTAACLRDLMRCELNPAAVDETGDDGGIEQDYNDSGDANDVDCITVLDPPGLDNCASGNTQ